MSEEQVEATEVVAEAEDTTSESAEPKAEPKSAAVTKPVPPAVKAKQDAEKAKAQAKPVSKSLVNKVGDPEKAKGEKPEGSGEEKIVPEKYELKLPEGASIDAELMPVFEEALKGERVSADGANKLAELHIKGVESAIQKYEANREAEAIAQDEKWETELKTEFGSKFQEEVAYVAKVRDMFFPQEVRDLFDKHHIGSHPALIKAMIQMGKKFSESKVVEGGRTPQAGGDASKLYPSMQQK